jgi:hypothetical protein
MVGNMNTTQTAIPAARKLATLVAAQTTSRLVESFCLTEDLLVGISPEDARAVYVTRGALMDEIERRNPEAFGAWLDQDGTPESLRALFA